MRTRKLGTTGLDVSCIGLGAMPLSLASRPNEKDAIQVLHAALDAGMTLIDTADVYCLDDDDIGHNERLITQALQERSDRDRVIVATKGGLRRPGGAWTVDARPERLQEACESSLEALGVEAIELYQLHAPDPTVPFPESVGALADLQQAGKIRHIGLSNVNVTEIKQAQRIVEVASVQNRCNPFDTSSFENGVVSYCERNGIAFLPHSPVGGHKNHGRVASDSALCEIARRYDATPYEICLAWLLSLSKSMIPIPGASQVASARSSAAAAALPLEEKDLRQLQEQFPAVTV